MKKAKALARIQYLLTEGFYLFAFTYDHNLKKAWVEYSTGPTISSNSTVEEIFGQVSPKEAEKCKDIMRDSLPR